MQCPNAQGVNSLRLSQFVVRRPVTVSMMVAVILLLGCLAVTRLEIDMLPNLQLPVVGIVTVYPGADPQAVEGQITNRIESAIATVSGLKSLQSSLSPPSMQASILLMR
jgi:HAE1 family hydrophobic/amphiphilic exporter-1